MLHRKRSLQMVHYTAIVTTEHCLYVGCAVFSGVKPRRKQSQVCIQFLNTGGEMCWQQHI